MKTKIAAAVSMLGVLGAGSAAALVNTRILETPSESGASAAVVPPASSIDVAVPAIGTLPVETTMVTLAESSTSTTEATVPETAPPATPAASELLTAFNVGEAGVVTVDVVDGRIVLVSAEPKEGWRITKSEEQDEDNGVEVDFESATVRVEFEADVVDGRIVPNVESESLLPPPQAPAPAAQAPAPAAPTTTTTHHDDHDDDRYEDDDHDDDDRYEDDDHDDDDRYEDDDHDEREDD
jgi:hypothetical protein